jgi:PAS domain S-box-containing protein
MSSNLYHRSVPYGVAIASTGIAVLLSFWLQPVLEHTIGAFFYIAVILSASYGGLRAGTVATILSALAIDYIFISPAYQLSINAPKDFFRLIIFLLVAFVINVLSSNLRLSRYSVEKLNQQLLRESGDRLKMALTAAQMGLWDWNILTGEMIWSPEHEQLFGLAPNTFDGKYETFNTCLHPDDQDQLTQAVQTALQNGTIFQHEYRVIWADGSVHWLEGRGQATYDAARQAVRMSGTVMNIDDRKRTETALMHSEHQFRAIFEAEPESIKIVTADGILRTINPAGLAMIEADSLDQAIGQCVCPMIESTHQQAFSEFTQRVAQGKPGIFEFQITGMQGTRRWLESHAVPLTRADEPTPLVLAVTRDITERKQTELALQQLMAELEQRVIERTAELQEANDRLQKELFQRVRVERELQESATFLRSLYQVIASRHQSFEQRIQDLLVMGCQLFGLEFGILARIQNGQYQVMVARSPDGVLKPGDTFDVKQTLCCDVLNISEPLAIEHTGGSKWRHHPAYTAFQMECYIGTRVIVGGETYSTISFSSKTPGIGKFKPAHKELLKLMAQWIGSEIERQQAEADLREMSVALENAVAGISRLDAEGKYVAVNHAYANPAGYKPEEILGMNWQKTVHPDDIEKLELAYQQMLQNGKVELEAKGIRKDGSTFYKQLVMISIYDEQHQFIGHHCFMKDISDRKEAQKTLELQSVMVNNMAGGVCLVKASDCTIVYTNPKFVAMFGYTAGELTGQSANVLNYANANHSSAQTTLEITTQLDREGEAKYEIHNVKKDGTPFWCKANTSKFEHSEYGTVYVAVQEDITELKQAEEALQQSEQRFHAIFNSTFQFTGLLTLDGTFLEANQTALDFAGIQRSEVVGLPVWETPWWISSEAKEQIKTAVNRAAQGEFVRYEVDIQGAGDIIATIDFSLKPILDKTGQVSLLLPEGRDISDRKQMEEQLRRSEAALIEAQRVARLGNWELDLTTQQITWSEELFRMFGFDPANPEPAYAEYFNYIHPDDRELLQSCITQASEHGTPYQIDLRFFRTDGSIGYMESKGRALRDEHGRITRLFGTALDISDRKQAEEALRQSESTNRALVSAIPDLLIRVRSDGTYLDFLANSDINFIDPKRIQDGLSIYDVLPFDQAKERLDYIQQVLQTNQVLNYEYELLIDNQLHYEEARIVPLQQDEVLVVVRDISDRKQAEAVLQESNRRWRSLLDNVQLVVIGLDINGNVEYANPFFLQLTGYDLEDVLGRYWFDSFLSAGQRQSVEVCFREVVEHNFHTHYQNSIATRLGEERMIAWNNTVLRDASGQPIGTISIGEDITERYRLERMKAEFVSVVSHELRTPLTSMQAALSLLVEKIIDPTSEEGETIIQIAAEGVDRLVRLVNDILDLERLDSGKVRLEKQLCNTAHLIATAVDQMQEMANQAGVTLDVAANPFEITADGDRLLQVLTNLLSNAIKFSSGGSTIGLSVELQPENEKTTLLFTVKDQGRGIPTHKLEAIFERFQQVDASDSREKGGTGLGLAICRTIVEQHGGHIWVDSMLEQGSIFYFTIPIAEGNSNDSQASFDH